MSIDDEGFQGLIDAALRCGVCVGELGDDMFDGGEVSAHFVHTRGAYFWFV